VAPFADPQVGAVSGELVLEGETRDRRTLTSDRRGRIVRPIAASLERRAPDNRRHSMQSTIAEGVGLYWRYEKQIRRDESAIASTMGATGAMYAMRRSLWRPLPEDTILDDVLAPMNPRFSCPGAIRRGSSSSRTRWRGSPSLMRCRRCGCSAFC
jgi:hypothetical protein